MVELDGGELTIEWREGDGHVLMTGPVAVEFTGTLDAVNSRRRASRSRERRGRHLRLPAERL